MDFEKPITIQQEKAVKYFLPCGRPPEFEYQGYVNLVLRLVVCLQKSVWSDLEKA